MKRLYVQEDKDTSVEIFEQYLPYPQLVQARCIAEILEPIHLSGKHTFLHTKMYFQVVYVSDTDVAHFKHLKPLKR